MIVALDVETQGLNTKKFIQACIVTDNGEVFHFKQKKKCWEWLTEKATHLEKHNKHLLVYGHNMIYDFLSIAELPNKDMTFYATRPFIAQYKDNLHFLDTMALYPGPLSKMGKLLGEEKGPTPEWLKAEKYKPNFMELNEMARYLQQDTRIVLEGVMRMKNKLKEDGIYTRRLITIGQIAINYCNQQLKKHRLHEHIFDQTTNKHGVKLEHYNVYWETQRKDFIHTAYRGGRIECFKKGEFKRVDASDINSLYPWACTKMPFPDLRTQRRLVDPEMNVLDEYGISLVAIRAPTCAISLLPIRYEDNIHYPHKGELLIGTWTNYELRVAMCYGYTIEKVFESEIWDILEENPLAEVMRNLYKKRFEQTEEYDNAFYKLIMNNITGKYGQRRPQTRKMYDSVERYEEYIQQGYAATEAFQDHYLYEKTTGYMYKGYSSPQIAAHITAYGRVRLYEDIIRFHPDDVLYCDTDSIFSIHDKSTSKKLKYGNGLGEWKQQAYDEPFLLYGNKTYALGEDFHVSGASRAFVTTEDVRRGVLEYPVMRTFATAETLAELGTFTMRTRDLNEERISSELPVLPPVIVDSSIAHLMPDLLSRFPTHLTEVATYVD